MLEISLVDGRLILISCFSFVDEIFIQEAGEGFLKGDGVEEGGKEAGHKKIRKLSRHLLYWIKTSFILT